MLAIRGKYTFSSVADLRLRMMKLGIPITVDSKGSLCCLDAIASKEADNLRDAKRAELEATRCVPQPQDIAWTTELKRSVLSKLLRLLSNVS
jgi:hypothetical protein